MSAAEEQLNKVEESAEAAAPEPALEPVAEPVAEPVTEPALEPVAEPVAEPVTEPVTEPAAEPVAEPVAEPALEPVTELADEPVAEPVPNDENITLAIVEQTELKTVVALEPAGPPPRSQRDIDKLLQEIRVFIPEQSLASSARPAGFLAPPPPPPPSWRHKYAMPGFSLRKF
jgi:hypothetical protein